MAAKGCKYAFWFKGDSSKCLPLQLRKAHAQNPPVLQEKGSRQVDHVGPILGGHGNPLHAAHDVFEWKGPGHFRVEELAARHQMVHVMVLVHDVPAQGVVGAGMGCEPLVIVREGP
eukprot:3455669-Alexandrium_andersonii.AAC.3